MPVVELARHMDRQAFREPTDLLRTGEVPSRIVLPVKDVHEFVDDNVLNMLGIARVMLTGLLSPDSGR